ncbi:MAG: ATP-binding protein [Prevotella sp.]|nr:ATP-binding protein [Prevotella sp.]
MAREEIIGRKREIALLDSYMATVKPEFVALYGRRRIGKTFLVKKLYEESFDFYVTGIFDKSKKEQLANFNRQLNNYSNSFYPVVDNWFDAFAQLQHYLTTLKDKKRILLFFDELPWMDTPRSKFIRALELFWNEWASSQNNIKFIVCGSATTWMTSKLLGDKGGLHNRVTRQIKLRPFSLAETEEYLVSLGFRPDRLQTIDAYMCVGGTPFYLNMFNPMFSVTQNIDELFFSEDAPLKKEFPFLFRSLFNDSITYKRIVELLGDKLKGMTRSEIIKSLKLVDNGNITEILDNLCQCDFIRKYSAYGKKQREVMYQLIDLYSLFYIKHVINDNSQDPHKWSNMIDSGSRKAWSGYAFEQVCLLHLPQIKKKLGIDTISTDVCSWQNDNAQIDLIIDRRDRIINLCEMKYCDKPFSVTKSYLAKMEQRRECFAEATSATKALHLTLIAPYGIANNSQSVKIQSVVNMDDLFKTV